jgi:hypothetical protein
MGEDKIIVGLVGGTLEVTIQLASEVIGDGLDGPIGDRNLERRPRPGVASDGCSQLLSRRFGALVDPL